MVRAKATLSNTRSDASLPRQRAAVVKNLADFQTEVARIAAGFVPAMRGWPNRKELPRLVFQDFRVIQDLRVRHKELGIAGGEVYLSRAVLARGVIELLCEAPSAADAIEAIYGRLKPALAAWLKGALRNDLGIYDIPSTPLLESNLNLLQQQAAWGSAARRLEGEPDAEFMRRVDAALPELSEALHAVERRTAEPCREARQIGRLPLTRSLLPQGFRSQPTVPVRDPKDDTYQVAERYYAANFLQEIQAADSCASLLFDSPDLPWDFYFDCARHMWDESRHATFGELKLQALGISLAEVPLSTTAYQMRQTLTPHDRYAALTTQEADAFPGKHAGLKAALENNDTIGAMTWSYDIADETQHVRYGQKWLPVMIQAMRDPRSVDQVRIDADNWRDTVLAAAYYPNRALPARTTKP